MIYELDSHDCDSTRAEATARLSSEEPSDEQLMARIRQREDRALDRLIRRYQPILIVVVGRIVPDRQDVKDILGDVFLSVWNQAANLDTRKGPVLGLLITIARRRAIDRVRHRQNIARLQARFRIFTEASYGHISAQDTARDAADSDRGEVLKTLFARLPPLQSQAVHLAYYQGLSQQEIANKIGIPLTRARSRLERGFKKLRAAVAGIGSREDWLSGPG